MVTTIESIYVKEIYAKYAINIFYNPNELLEIYFWSTTVRCN